MVSPKDLEEFKKIIKKDYGVGLNDLEATRLSQDFLIALEAVLKSSKSSSK